VSLGFDRAGLGVVRAVASSEALDRDMRQVLVLAVVAEPDESLRDELRLESCEGFLVMSQEDARLFGSSSRNGMPQWWACRHESERDDEKFSLDDTDDARLCCFCCISAIR